MTFFSRAWQTRNWSGNSQYISERDNDNRNPRTWETSQYWSPNLRSNWNNLLMFRKNYPTELLGKSSQKETRRQIKQQEIYQYGSQNLNCNWNNTSQLQKYSLYETSQPFQFWVSDSESGIHFFITSKFCSVAR